MPARRGGPGGCARGSRGSGGADVENLREALANEGAGFGDLVKVTIYVVGEERADLVRVWNVVSPLLGRVPNTLLGVSFLGYPDQLVEIEAIAYQPPGGTT